MSRCPSSVDFAAVLHCGARFIKTAFEAVAEQRIIGWWCSRSVAYAGIADKAIPGSRIPRWRRPRPTYADQRVVASD
jgi:hypothetical protein